MSVSIWNSGLPYYDPTGGPNLTGPMTGQPTNPDLPPPTHLPTQPGLPPAAGPNLTGPMTGQPKIPDANSGSKIVSSNTQTYPIMWNPPAHNLTKPPRIAWQNYDLSKEFAQNTLPDSNLWDNAVGTYQKTVQGRLGAIYTDQWMEGATTSKYRWGVQFHYNPTSFSESATVDPSIAALTLGQGGSLLGNGSVSVGFDLYFNRIYDMVASPSDYPIKLRTTPEDQLKYIRTFGTMYDIEYLYRACNGDPRQVRGLSYKTANFGFLTQALVRLDLGPTKYIGMISSLEIDHILFTPNMVPTFSKVSINFIRQITLDDGSVTTSTGQKAKTASSLTDWTGAVTGQTSS